MKIKVLVNSTSNQGLRSQYEYWHRYQL